jgi:hypothetical protein
MQTLSLSESMKFCIATTKKGSPCKYKVTNGSFCATHVPKPTPVVEDRYTEDVLRMSFTSHKDYVQVRMKIKEQSGLSIRMPNMPEDISENITKFIIHRYGNDDTSKWTKGIMKNNQKITGDLCSEKEGAQEVKCFTSDGPPSFGPSENWDTIYFLDARRFMEDHFVLWRVALSNTSTEWKQIRMNKTQTHEDQSNQNRRPRITWDSLYPQIQSHTTKIFDGTFNEIFTKAME